MSKRKTVQMPDSTIKIRSIEHDTSGNFDKSLDGHFLADRMLSKRKVASLLLSSSFGANSILYATFLGYLMGMWGLLIQIAWMASFYLLAPFSEKIHRSTSLHDFIGEKFGLATRKLAALCSIVGILYFVGWDYAIARTSLQSIAGLSIISNSLKSIPVIILFIATLSVIIYSAKWGRKASGSINLVLNLIKVACLFLLVILTGIKFISSFGFQLNVLFPPIRDAVLAVGFMGLATNIGFNVVWQFVDNSSWQSVSSAEFKDKQQISRSIRLAGIGTFLTVNGLGTLLGAMVRPISNVDSVNILGIVSNNAILPVLTMCLMLVLVLLSAMSLFDGAILSISQSIIVDFGLRRSGKLVTLRLARYTTLIVGIVAVWGVDRIITVLGGSIFNMTYLVILTQLSLIGPVVIGLVRPKQNSFMWVSIIISLICATVITAIGTFHNNQNLIQFAGISTLIVSLLSSAAISLFSRYN